MKWDVSQLSGEQLCSAIEKANAWPQGRALNTAEMLSVVDHAAYLLFQMKWCWDADHKEQKMIDTILTGKQLQEEVDAFVLEYCRRLVDLRTDDAQKEYFMEGMSAVMASQFFMVTGVTEVMCLPTSGGVYNAARAYLEKHHSQDNDEVDKIEDEKETEAQKIARTRCLCLSSLFFISGSTALTVSSSVILANQLASMSTLAASTALHGLPMVGLALALGMMCIGIYLAVAWSQQPKRTFSELFCRKTSEAAVESKLDSTV